MALRSRALDTPSGPVLTDAADHQPALRDRLAQAGFTLQRRFMRMTRGDPDLGITEKIFAAAGPEFG